MGLLQKNRTHCNIKQDLLKFIEALFPDLGDGYIETRKIGAGQKTVCNFHKTFDDLLQLIQPSPQQQNGYNIYFGVCPRADRVGTKQAVKNVLCLWADLDAKDFDGGKRQILKSLDSFPVPPMAVVDSGNGYHAYWRLKEPEAINGPKDVVRVEVYLKGIARTLGGDRSAAELARVLRLPGTLNLKDPQKPKPVTIVRLDGNRECNLTDFDDWIDLPHEGTTANNNAVSPDNRPGWIAQALGNLHEGNRNHTFAKVIGRLNRDGWSPDDIFGLLIPHARESGFPEDELRQEVEGISRRYPSTTPFPVSPIYMEKSETETAAFKTIRLEELMAMPHKDITWIIDNILPESGVGILAGPAGYGKSWMLLDLAVECVLGGKWLGQFPTATGVVLYVDEESTEALLQHRLRKLLCAKGKNHQGMDLHFAIGQGLHIDNPQSINRLREKIEEVIPRLVIIDSLVRVHRRDENSAMDMANMFGVIKELVREYNCSFMFADHHRKQGLMHTGPDQMLRGSTEKAAFVDTLLSLRRKDDLIVVDHAKSRFAEPVSSFAVRLADPKPDATTVTYAGEADEIKRKEREDQAGEYIKGKLGDGEWHSRKELIEQAKTANVPTKAIDDVLGKLTDENQVEREDRKPPEGRGGKQAFFKWVD